jgi:hypothetical protein
MEKVCLLNYYLPNDELVIGKIRFFKSTGLKLNTYVGQMSGRWIYNYCSFHEENKRFLELDPFPELESMTSVFLCSENPEISSEFAFQLLVFITDNYSVLKFSKSDPNPPIEITKEIQEKFYKLVEICSSSKNKNIQITINRYISAVLREEIYDKILDLCSCLESFFKGSNEIRIRLSLLAYYISNSKQVMLVVYRMYGKRNDIIHGNKYPVISELEVSEYFSAIDLLFQNNIKNGKMINVEDLNKNLLEDLPI